MGITRKIMLVALTYAAFKIGGCCYANYNEYKDKGVAVAAEDVVRRTGSYLRKGGEYLERVELDKPVEKEPSELEKQAEG